MRFISRTRLVAIAVAAIASGAASTGGLSQEPRRLLQSDSIPLDLAAALISAGGFNGAPQILVGAIPAFLTGRLDVPVGARVLGSAFLGSTVVAVMSVPNAPDTIVSQLRNGLLLKGWKNAPAMPRYAIGGFQPAPAPPPLGPLTRVNLCADQQSITVWTGTRHGSSVEVNFRVSPAGNPSVCNMPQFPAAGMRLPPWPALFNPAGVADTRLGGDCSSTIGGTSGTGTTFRTAMSAEAILEHYGRQLLDSGWTTGGEKGAIVGRTFMRADSTGTPVDLTLSVTTSARDSGCREVNMQVRTLRKP
jgi:hypothetical protein